MIEALQILQKYWKHQSFRTPQDQIIQSVLAGNDTFALLPTGGGKSVCFQVPGLLSNGITLVISPLIALIKDQVANLQQKNIKAIGLIGGSNSNEISDLLDNCQFGNYKFLYLSPERLQQEWIVDRLKLLPISLIAIDEAHCVSQWGHDFRPAYLKIKDLKTHFPEVPFLALTASATLRVQEDIITHLALKNPVVFKKSFARDNLGYHVIPTDDKLHKIQQIVSKNKQSSIIYVRNRRSCLEVSQQLNSLGHSSTYFHGGLSLKEKEKNMQLWMENKVQIIVATNAFGMGIDKPDVKTVIHIQLPENLENYYQEAGRAGRNGEKAFGILLVSSGDVETAKKQFIANLPDKKFLKEVYIKLNNYFQIAYGEGFGENFSFNVNHFAQQYQFPIVKTVNALQFLDRQGIISLSNEFSEKVNLQFILPSKEIIRYVSLHPKDEAIITAILRTYSGIFDMGSAINLNFIAKKAHCTTEAVLEAIKQLEKSNCVVAQIQNNDSSLTFNEVREDDLTINRVAKYLEKQNEIKTNQLARVISYITDEKTCKSKLLLTYFDEKDIADCGICSTCLSKQKSDPNQIVPSLLSALDEPKTARELEENLEISKEALIFALQSLLENNQIAINSHNQYYLL